MMIPSSGVVLYNYQKPDLKNKEYKKSIAKIGYIPQTLGLVKNTSVLENVLIGALHVSYTHMTLPTSDLV